jgi:4-hydroxythreonine-4-phosphate dehydrogenase
LIKKKIETVKQSLIRDFSINKPKIAVLGLNRIVATVALLVPKMICKPTLNV